MHICIICGAPGGGDLEKRIKKINNKYDDDIHFIIRSYSDNPEIIKQDFRSVPRQHL